MTYIPMIVGMGLTSKFEVSQTLNFQFFLLVSFFCTGGGYFIKSIKVRYINLSKIAFKFLFALVSIILLAYVVIVFKDTMRLVNPLAENLYDLRFEGRDVAMGSYVGYAVTWLASAFLPFLFCIGVVYKKKIYVFLAILGQLTLYMTAANKSFILSIFFMLFVFFLQTKTRKTSWSLTLILSSIILILISSQLLLTGDLKLLSFGVTSLFMLRTLAISSVNVVNYFDFFQSNPFTNYSHINIIGKIIHYPYGDLSLGQMIGKTISGNSDSNYNANFFITDGFSAMGSVGLVIIGIISGIIFYIVDAVLKKHDKRFTIMLLSYVSINLMNLSIFTTLFSGGFALLTLFCFFLPKIEK